MLASVMAMGSIKAALAVVEGIKNEMAKFTTIIARIALFAVCPNLVTIAKAILLPSFVTCIAEFNMKAHTINQITSYPKTPRTLF